MSRCGFLLLSSRRSLWIGEVLAGRVTVCMLRSWLYNQTVQCEHINCELWLYTVGSWPVVHEVELIKNTSKMVVCLHSLTMYSVFWALCLVLHNGWITINDTKIIFSMLKISAVSKVQVNLCWMFVLFVLMPVKKMNNQQSSGCRPYCATSLLCSK